VGGVYRTQTHSSFCCARVRAVSASTSPPPTPASSTTLTGTPRTICRRRHAATALARYTDNKLMEKGVSGVRSQLWISYRYL